MSDKLDSKQASDNHANQLNPEHAAYHLSRGLSPAQAEQAAREARESNAKPEGQAPTRSK